MDAIVIVQVLRLAGYEEEDQRQHKIHDTIEQQDTIKTAQPIQNTVFQNVEMDQKHKRKHAMMETQTMEMDVTVTEHQWKLVGCAEVDQSHQQTHDTTEHQAIIKIIQIIQNTVCIDVEMGQRCRKKLEMMETQLVMMDEVLIEIVLKRVMYVEEDHQLHQTHDIIAHQDITKTMHPIQNTVSIDAETAKKCLKNHETMETLSVMMVVAQTEHQLNKIMYELEEVQHQKTHEQNAQMDIIKTTPPILNTESQDVEMDTEQSLKNETMEMTMMGMDDHHDASLNTTMFVLEIVM